MTKIRGLIEDFKLNQEVLEHVKRYIDVCMFRLNRWEEFMEKDLDIVEVEDVSHVHIKKYIQERQRLGREINRTLNNNLATLKVFFQYLVDEEFMDEQSNSTRRIKNLREAKTVIITFNDEEVSRIINDLKEENTLTSGIS